MTDLSDRQGASGRQGRAFEETVEILLLIEGWDIIDRHWRHPAIGIEIDLVAKDPDGVEWWIECKGSWESPSRNGLMRTDTLKKAIFNGALLRRQDDSHPYMIITSHLPVQGAGLKWVEQSLIHYVDEIREVNFTRFTRNPFAREVRRAGVEE